GRIAVTEVMPMTKTLRDMIIKRATSDDLREQAIKEGMKTLREDALIKLKQGLTSVEEVIRVTSAM
ncbi:hypothetical protein J7L85_02660, partial [candidate division WOR-3 bacterium]|nr:hypothetical protein [candidate division WOR-3 bacterium]